jgi:protein-L-isoaspartate(D-aspartate) O-methyltransferase
MARIDPKDRLEAARRSYAEELRFVARVRSEAVIGAFATVPRETFLGPGPWSIMSGIMGDEQIYWPTSDANPAHLYHNVLVAIDPSRRLNNGQPQFWARLLDALDLRSGDKVLHVGAGTGYYTAILAELVGPTGRVLGTEVDSELADRARHALANRPNVEMANTNGAVFDPGAVDAIIVNAGVTHPMPVWLSALNPGGRMLMPLTTERWDGIVLRIERVGAGPAFAAGVVSDVGIYPCVGAREQGAERAVVRALAAGGQRFIRSLRFDRHKPGHSCWLHGDGFCLSLDLPRTDPVPAQD